MVLSLAFAGIVCIGLSGRTLSLWRVTVSVFISQLIFHGLFSFGAPGGALVLADAPATNPVLGLHQHGPIGIISALGESASGPLAHAGAHDSTGMWIAHALAAVVTVVALRHGAAALESLFSSVRLGIRSLFGALAGVYSGVAVPAIRRRVASTASIVTPRDLTIVLSAMRHRGPPVLSAT